MNIRKDRVAEDSLDKYLGFVYGVAIGDALGAPVEGMRSYEIENVYGKVENYIDLPISPNEIYQKPQARFRLSKTYTDDTQNLLLGMEHLLNNDYSFDRKKMSGEMAEAYVVLRGMGRTTRKALRTYRNSNKEKGFSLAPGNGAVLRAVPFMLGCDDVDFEMITSVSGLTHQNLSSQLGAFFYSSLVHELIDDRDSEKQVISERNLHRASKIFEELDVEMEIREWRDTELMLSNFQKVLKESSFSPEFSIKEIGTSSRIYHSLPVALHCFLTGEDYREAVLNAVNLGGDADSIAAFTGGLIGAHLGYMKIPNELKYIRNHDYLLELTDQVAQRKPNTMQIGFMDVEERLTFEETAIQMHIKRTMAKQRQHCGIKTKVNGNEIREIGSELGLELQGQDIGKVKKALRQIENNNPTISRDEEVEYIRAFFESDQ